MDGTHSFGWPAHFQNAGYASVRHVCVCSFIPTRHRQRQRHQTFRMKLGPAICILQLSVGICYIWSNVGKASFTLEHL